MKQLSARSAAVLRVVCTTHTSVSGTYTSGGVRNKSPSLRKIVFFISYTVVVAQKVPSKKKAKHSIKVHSKIIHAHSLGK